MADYAREKLAELFSSCLTSTGSHARGAALEDLVEHVFCETPSVQLFERDVKDEGGIQEIDLVFSHHFHISEIPIHDVCIMVECKNESEPTSSAQITVFAGKLRSRSLNTGIFVSSRGLSGSGVLHAHGAIRDALNSGVAIIVVTTFELASLRSTSELAEILRSRYMELATYRTYRKPMRTGYDS